MGTAACKTVELVFLIKQRTNIGNAGPRKSPITKLFKEITCLEGVDSDSTTSRAAADPKLFRVRKTKHTVRVAEVPCTRKSLNQGDCFLFG